MKERKRANVGLDFSRDKPATRSENIMVSTRIIVFVFCHDFNGMWEFEKKPSPHEKEPNDEYGSFDGIWLAENKGTV
jgi:hypothetical protein